VSAAKMDQSRAMAIAQNQDSETDTMTPRARQSLPGFGALRNRTCSGSSGKERRTARSFDCWRSLMRIKSLPGGPNR